jgi:WD40 repeat protein
MADPLRAHNEASWFLEFSPDGTILASASYDGTAKLWNLLNPAHPAALGQPLANPHGGLSSVTFRLGGRDLATSGESGAIALWTLPTGVIPNHVGRIDSPAFSADGTVMVTASDNVVQLWTNDSHLTRRATLRLPDSSQRGLGYAARVDPAGRILATALTSAPTVLWDITDITNPIELSTLPNTAKYTDIVAFSPDGRTVATAGDDSTVQLWDIAEPTRPQRLSEPLTGLTGPYINTVAFSPDGRAVFAGSTDNTMCIWDITDRNHPTPSTTVIPATPPHSRPQPSAPMATPLPSAVKTGPSSFGTSPTRSMRNWLAALYIHAAMQTSSRSARTERHSHPVVTTAASSCGTSPIEPTPPRSGTP